MVLKQESHEFDSLFYSTIGNLSKEMSLQCLPFLEAKQFVLVTYLILLFYPKSQATVINPFLQMYLIDDNFSHNSYLWERRV